MPCTATAERRSEAEAEAEAVRRQLAAEAGAVAGKLQALARQREASIGSQVFNLADYVGRLVATVSRVP